MLCLGTLLILKSIYMGKEFMGVMIFVSKWLDFLAIISFSKISTCIKRYVLALDFSVRDLWFQVDRWFSILGKILAAMGMF